jgi:hypothetical protein
LRLQIDKQIGPSGSRSAFIEKVLSDHLEKLAREKIGARDLILTSVAADRLTAGMESVLRNRADIFETHEDQANTQ